MIEAIVLALIIAKFKKYKFKEFFKQWAVYPALACAVIYAYLEYTIFKGDYSLLKYSSIFKVTAILAYMLPAVRYRQYLAGIVSGGCVIAGNALNLLVINANNGKMPVFPTLSLRTGYVKPDLFVKANDGLHVMGDAGSKLKFLSDWIDVGYSVMSLGDVLTRVMVVVIIYYIIKCANLEGGNG